MGGRSTGTGEDSCDRSRGERDRRCCRDPRRASARRVANRCSHARVFLLRVQPMYDQRTLLRQIARLVGSRRFVNEDVPHPGRHAKALRFSRPAGQAGVIERRRRAGKSARSTRMEPSALLLPGPESHSPLTCGSSSGVMCRLELAWASCPAASKGDSALSADEMQHSHGQAPDCVKLTIGGVRVRQNEDITHEFRRTALRSPAQPAFGSAGPAG